MNLASANRADVGKPPLQWHSDGVLATLGWVVKASEGGTGWRLPTVTRADRSPTGEASLARGRLTSRQRLHEAEVVFHQVQGSRPCHTHKLALHTRSAILPLSRRRSVHLRVVNAPTCKGTDRCGSWTTSGCVINALLICTRMVSFQHPPLRPRPLWWTCRNIYLIEYDPRQTPPSDALAQRRYCVSRTLSRRHNSTKRPPRQGEPARTQG